jgi:hypothetical protein
MVGIIINLSREARVAIILEGMDNNGALSWLQLKQPSYYFPCLEILLIFILYASI